MTKRKNWKEALEELEKMSGGPEETSFPGCLTRTSIFLLSLPIQFLISGFVIMKLWEWFIVSAFSIQEITLIQAGGLWIFFHVIRFEWKLEKLKETGWPFVLDLLIGFYFDCCLLFMAWIFHLILF